MQNRFFSYLLILSFFSLSLSGCKSTALKHDSQTSVNSVREYSVQSLLWQQNSAEYIALCYQAFNVAKLNIDQFLADETLEGKKLAIITDIDETVFDNSPFNAKLIEKDEEFTQEEWNNWSNLEEAREVPGAAEFLNYVESRGVEIFYITNRMESEREATLRNMKKLNFPFIDNKHLLLRTETSSKKDRFEKVRKDYEVIMYLGDNLSDFSHKFGAPSSKERNDLAQDFKENWGINFIVLPNPMYGDWETKGIYKGKYDWSDREKDSIRKAGLRSY